MAHKDEYIPIETSQFHRSDHEGQPRRAEKAPTRLSKFLRHKRTMEEALDEAYNPDYYKAAKAKKDAAAYPMLALFEKLDQLRLAWIASGYTQETKTAYSSMKDDLKSKGLLPLTTVKNSWVKAYKAQNPAPQLTKAAPVIGGDDHIAQLKLLDKLRSAHAEQGGSDNWAAYLTHKKKLEKAGLLPVKLVGKGWLNSHLAAVKSKEIEAPAPSEPITTTNAAHTAVMLKMIKLDELRTAMVTNGYSKIHTAAYDAEKAKLKAEGILPPATPGKNWLTAYKIHTGMIKADAPAPAPDPLPYVPKPKPADDEDPDDWTELHKRLVHHYATDSAKGNNAISIYTGNGSRSLNVQMRQPADHPGHKDPTHIGKVNKLTKQVGGYEAQETFHVYTGVPKSPLDLHKDHFGVENTDKTSIKVHTRAFTSTSISKDIAKSFAAQQHQPGGNHKHIIRIRIPKGSAHGKYVAHESRHEREKEFILSHSKNLRIHPVPKIVQIHSAWGSPVHVHYWDAEIEPDHVGGPAIHAPKTKSAAKEKEKLVFAAMLSHPQMSTHAIAKMMAAQGHMTHANAMYFAQKLKKKGA